MSDQPISFAERRRRLLEERARERGEQLPAPPPVQQPEFRQDQVPDVLGDRSDEDLEIDKIIESIDVLTAYNKWCGKSQPKVGNGQREGIKVSCPNPSHPDHDPSAWLNLDTNLWYCGGCAEGGDSYDIAAFHFGYPRPAYKEGSLFHKLRRDMAEDMGYTFKKVAGGEVILPPEPDMSGSSEESINAGLDNGGTVRNIPVASAVPPPVSQPGTSDESGTPPGASENQGSLASVTSIDPDEEEDETIIYPTIDWRNIVPPDTFLRKYMEACSNDDSPEEYHFWHGLLALGHAAGHKVMLDDTPPVPANFLVCLLGGTGTGKSRSRGWLNTVVKAVMPYRETGMDTSGVKVLPMPGSGEFLVKQFEYAVKDPTTNRATGQFASVNGIVDFDELAALLARANRQGSSLKTTIMSFADAKDHITVGSLTSGTSYAEHPFCSITATTQPKALRTLLTRTDTSSGFLNRWVFAGGAAKEQEVLGGSHSSMVVDLDPAIEELKTVRAWAGFERKLTMEPDAYDAMVKFWKTKVQPVRNEDQTDLLKRIDLICKKIMVAMTINLKSDTVPLQVVNAVEHVFDYLVDCYGLLSDNIGMTMSQVVSNDVLSAIIAHTRKTGIGASGRDLRRRLNRKNYSDEQINKALDVLVKLGMADIQKPKTGAGRPTVRYVVVGE